MILLFARKAVVTEKSEGCTFFVERLYQVGKKNSRNQPLVSSGPAKCNGMSVGCIANARDFGLLGRLLAINAFDSGAEGLRVPCRAIPARLGCF